MTDQEPPTIVYRTINEVAQLAQVEAVTIRGYLRDARRARAAGRDRATLIPDLQVVEGRKKWPADQIDQWLATRPGRGHRSDMDGGWFVPRPGHGPSPKTVARDREALRLRGLVPPVSYREITERLGFPSRDAACMAVSRLRRANV